MASTKRAPKSSTQFEHRSTEGGKDDRERSASDDGERSSRNSSKGERSPSRLTQCGACEGQWRLDEDEDQVTECPHCGVALGA